MFIMEFATQLVDNIPWGRLINSTAAARALPARIRNKWVRPVVGHFYPATLARQVCNYSDVAHKTTPAQIQQYAQDEAAGTPCHCHQPRFDAYRDEHSGHVITTDLGVVAYQPLRLLLAKGAKFRVPKPTTRGALRAHLRQALSLFTMRLATRTGLPNNAVFEDWEDEIQAEGEELLKQLPAVRVDPGGEQWDDMVDFGVNLGGHLQGQLKGLQQRFVITTADKNTHAFSFVCRRHYINNITSELGAQPPQPQPQQQQGAYQLTNHTGLTALAGWTAFYQTNNRIPGMRSRFSAEKTKQEMAKTAAATLPHAFTTTKHHKNPVKHRHVAGAGAAASTRVSQAINDALSALMPDLHGLWREALCRLPGMRYDRKRQAAKFAAVEHMTYKCWITTSSHDVRQMLEALNRDASQPYHYSREKRGRGAAGGPRGTHQRVFRRTAKWGVYDFTTLYTTLPHNDPRDGLRQRMGRLLTSVFNRHKNHWLIIQKWGEPTWRLGYMANGLWQPPRARRGETVVGHKELVCWIGHLLDHCYLAFGGKIWQQVIGIPMGEACSGMLANFYLFSYELEFMMKLMAAKRWALAERFLYTKRYIDDIGSFNNNKFADRRYQQHNKIGIYPRQYLTLNEEQPPKHGPGRLLDLYITTDDKRCWYRTNAVTTAQDTRPRAGLRFPAVDTLLADRSKYGIVTAEAVRYQRCSTQEHMFVRLVADMVMDMRRRGYNMDKVATKARAAVAQGSLAYRGAGRRLIREVWRLVDEGIRRQARAAA